VKTLDLHFPISNYEPLLNTRTFNIIYPEDHPLSKNVDLKTMAHLVFWDDDEYSCLIHGEQLESKPEPMEELYYDVAYLKDCPLKYLNRAEWETNWGPNDLKSFFSYNKGSNYDTCVKLICLEKHNYSLKNLNEKYIRKEMFEKKTTKK